MVKLPDGNAERIPGVAGGGSGLGPAPSVEDLCKNMKRAEATHLGSLRNVVQITQYLMWRRSCDAPECCELCRRLRRALAGRSLVPQCAREVRLR